MHGKLAPRRAAQAAVAERLASRRCQVALATAGLVNTARAGCAEAEARLSAKPMWQPRWALAVLGLLQPGATAWSQTATEPGDTVQVIGTRAPTALSRVVADVVVIDRDRIRASSADSIEDLLRREGGMQLSRNGGPGQSASILIRGNGASNTLVLIDGVRVGSATLGQTDLAAISLAQVERVEIMRGPGSSLYGADAIGGVVNIVTRRGEGSPHLSGNVAAGTRQSAEGYLALGGASAVFDYALSASAETSDGQSAILPGDAFGQYNPDDDGFARSGVQLAGGFGWRSGQRIGFSYSASRLKSQFDSVQFLAPDFAADATPDFRNRLDTQLAAVDYSGTFSEAWAGSLRASYQSDRLQSGADLTSVYDTTRRQLTAQATWTPQSAQQLVLAAELLRESIGSSDYAAPDRDNTGLVLGYTGRFAEHKLQADLRWDHNSVYGNQTTGKVGWGMDLAQGWSLRLVAGTAFRAPTFNDLYFPGFGIVDLLPERSRSIEAGVGYRDASTTLDATIYHNKVSDLIGYQGDPAHCPPGFPFGCAGNFSQALLQGLTAQGVQRWGDFVFTLALDWLDAKDTNTDQKLPRRASNQQTLAVDWNLGPWQLGGTLLNVGSRPDAGVLLPAYQLLNLNARYRLAERWQLEARLQNALDEAYQPVADYQGSGRMFWLGLRFDGQGL
jgi:vitamin B12 transporter